MEEKIQEYVFNLLKEGVEFAKTEIPIYVNEYLNYMFYEHVILCLLFFILAFILCFLCIKAWKLFKKKEDFIFLVILLPILTIYFFTFFIINGFSAIKIKVSPKVYLIEKLTNKKC